MFHKTIKYLINHPFLAFALVLVFGFWGWVHAPFDWQFNIPKDPIPVDAIPDIGENQQIVFTNWEGNSPQDIEDQITYPLTTALLGIPNVKTIRSSSMFGRSIIYIIFDEKADFYQSRVRILEKLNALDKHLLPKNVRPKLGPDATGLGQIFWYTIEGSDSEGNPMGGWDLQELRSIQDYFVKYGLAAAEGVSEVASIGGFVKEYQVDIHPDLLKQYNISLKQVVNALQKTNTDIGAKTLEINKVAYLVRGLGKIKSLKDIENTVVDSKNFTPILIKDIAHVMIGPKKRNGILDKEGAEVVGGAVIARYGANPMEVIKNIKTKIKELEKGLPFKKLANGNISQLKIVPFYDRAKLIKETLHTLESALILEVLITILVIVFMVRNLKAALLIGFSLPIAVLMVFIGMRFLGVNANIVSLSGIAIAIGTMVDMGIILTENILKKLKNNPNNSYKKNIYKATKEVSGAILTAVLTTIISFVPIFTMSGAEGKLFKPLAATKTMALIAALFIALFLVPVFANVLFKKRIFSKKSFFLLQILNIVIGFLGIFFLKNFFPIILILFSGIEILKQQSILKPKIAKKILFWVSIFTILSCLAEYWHPIFLGSFFKNLIFVGGICLGILGFFLLFKRFYLKILQKALANKILFLSIPLGIIFLGFMIWQKTPKEFMPSLDEGAFLLMPTSLPHSGISENKKILQQLDKIVAQIPEVKTVVGKAGNIESALDPAPLSMYENIIVYHPEYTKNKNGTHKRNWRKHIKSPEDIWQEIVKITKIPGITSAPKLQPIETRLVMLQTGMRSNMGLKIKGQNLKTIENIGLEFEKILKSVEGIKKTSIFADRIVGKPYLLISIDREKLKHYGMTIKEIQDILEWAVSGKNITQTIEGRERYDVRIRYLREKRDNIGALKNLYIPQGNGKNIVLGDVANIRYEKGPQTIKSEDGFLVSYVLFDKMKNYSEVAVVQNAKKTIEKALKEKKLNLPLGVSYVFTGTYEQQLKAEKTLSLVIPLALLIIFIVLYFQFKNLKTCLMVFSSIAVAFSGGFIMMYFYGKSWFLDINIFGENLRELFHLQPIFLSVAVWVGFIALFGIATDDGVVMATYLTQIFKEKKPTTQQEIQHCIVKAGEKRVLPCLMTTATTILALLPVLTSKGKGSDIMIPMAIPCFGGMLMALITLFVVPVLFSMMKEFELKKQ